MFENQVIVSSAISTFNNAALWEPGFLWSFILALPLFALGWIMSPQITERFMPAAKTRDRTAAMPIVLVICVWVLSHGNFGVLRDGTSLVVILNAVILWLGLAWLSRRYYESKTRISKFIKHRRLKLLVDLAVPPAVVGACALAYIGAGRDEIILLAGAAGAGIITGWLLNWRNARERDPKIVAGAMMLLGSFCLVMQPEFFRFGQMSNLSIFHIIFLCLTGLALAMYFAMSLVRPRGWFSDAYYNRSKILMRAGMLFVLALLLITESAPVYGLFFLGVFTVAALGILHVKNEDHIKKTKHEMWLASMTLFGVLAALPVLVFVAAVMWRQTPHTGILKRIRELV